MRKNRRSQVQAAVSVFKQQKFSAEVVVVEAVYPHGVTTCDVDCVEICVALFV